MNAFLRDTLRHYLHVIALCCVVAMFTTLMWPNRSYLSQLFYALCIGTVCWSVMEFGRFAIPAHHCHDSGDGGRSWPKGWRGLLLVITGSVKLVSCSHRWSWLQRIHARLTSKRELQRGRPYHLVD